MPAIKCAEAARKKCCELVTPSIVSVNTYDSSDYTFDFTTGFVIYSERGKTLICVHNSVVNGKTPLYVHFSNVDIEKAEIFLKNTPSGHVVLKTGGRARRAVSFSQNAAKREDVFTIAAIEGGYLGFNFMTGTVCCPSCKAVDEKSGVMIRGSKETFAMTCGAIKWPHERKTKNELIGAAVFELVHGMVVGTIKSLDKDAYDLKFASQSYCWVDKLEKLLKARDKAVKLKVNPEESSKVKKRKRTEENSMAGQLQLELDRQFL